MKIPVQKCVLEYITVYSHLIALTNLGEIPARLEFFGNFNYSFMSYYNQQYSWVWMGFNYITDS